MIALRREQGKQIDRAKSVIVTEFPSHWTRYTKMDFSLSEEERKEIEDSMDKEGTVYNYATVAQDIISLVLDSNRFSSTSL
mgnify:CR=1 FL=1